MSTKRRRKTRMPGPGDVDKRGMVKIQVVDKQGNKKAVHRCAVDARELILSDSGTLDIDGDVEVAHNEQDAVSQLLQGMDLDTLRAEVTKRELSWIGKPESALRLMLIADGFALDDDDEDDA